MEIAHEHLFGPKDQQPSGKLETKIAPRKKTVVFELLNCDSSTNFDSRRGPEPEMTGFNTDGTQTWKSMVWI